MQDITAASSRKTVQAPHSPSAQPSLVPVRPASSRSQREQCFLLTPGCLDLTAVHFCDDRLCGIMLVAGSESGCNARFSFAPEHRWLLREAARLFAIC